MKKGSISILIVLVLSVLININYVNAATITINGEQWDESKKCVYVQGNYNLTIYYKGTQTILKRIGGDGIISDYIKNDNDDVTRIGLGTFVKNEVIIDEQYGCPEKIYQKEIFHSNRSKFYYSSTEYEISWFNKTFGGQSQSTFDIFSKYKPSEPSKSSIDNRQPCEKIIDESTKQLINKYLGYIHIIVPMLIIALGTYDFFRAIIASKEDEMKKAQKRFIVRLVAGVLVFLAPTIVNIIIDILNSTLVGNKVCELSISIQNYVY